MKLIVALMVCCVIFGFGASVCRINGTSYGIDVSVGRVIDGCNRCSCAGDGFDCTRMGCGRNRPRDCEIRGQHYDHYDIIESDDCDECRCMNGNLVCTGCPD